MKPVFVEKSIGTEAFDAVKADWQRLFVLSECAPFMTWEWMSAWFENFAEGRSPFFLKAYRDGEVIGILPMIVGQEKFLGMRYKRLALMGDGIGGADQLDIVAAPSDKSVVAAAMVEYIQSEKHCDIASFENLSADSDAAKKLSDHQCHQNGSIANLSISTQASCPQIDLRDGWDSILGHCKRKDNFKRRLKKLEKMDGFEFRSVSDPAETGAAFERFLRLHQLRWESSGGSELSGHPRLIAFQRQVVSALSDTGIIRFDELWADGECRASVYGLDNGRTFYYYNSGYDGDYARYSVGLVLLGLSVKNAVERGNDLYDFLRGEENYKFEWANRSTELVTITLSRNTLPIMLDKTFGQIVTTIETVAKVALPSGFRQILANWRRAWKRNYQLSE